LSEQTLRALAKDGVSDKLVAKLKSIKDVEFNTPEAFLKDLGNLLDEQELKQTKEKLLTHAEHTISEIEFHNVCFSYQPGKPTLENISFKVQAGETIAIVGPNGCGKTTLLNLLPRFYDPDHGSIFIDGIDLRTAHLRSLRKQIGVVTQDTILFDDTIYNNIAYGSPGATKEEIEAAGKKAFAHEFIMEQPLGYDTKIGEMRMPSGGEKQRIALARAILRDPSILILDEFTSAIDAVSDSLIHSALKDFAKGRTTFIITHKMHTLEIADRIIVLNRGNIEAIGTSAELLRTSPLFRSLQEANGQRMVA
jgi:ATP-binding cassette subfamily B protein/subfamily B ATP-binding cassette protein MsbA